MSRRRDYVDASRDGLSLYGICLLPQGPYRNNSAILDDIFIIYGLSLCGLV